MRGSAMRALDPPDTVVESTVVSVLHDIALAFLVCAQIAVVVVFHSLKRLNHIAIPSFRILKSIAGYVKSVIVTLTRPFIAFLRGIDAFCIAIHNDPSSHAHFMWFGVLLVLIQWYCSGVGWDKIHPTMATLLSTLLWIWPILSVWAIVAFLRYQWRSRAKMDREKRKSKARVEQEVEETRTFARRKRNTWRPGPFAGAHSHNAAMSDSDSDGNRNWSNEHGNLSPKPPTPYKPSNGNLRRRPAITKILDSDNNRNWSNEHGNLSPKSLSPVESASGICKSGCNAAAASSTAISTPSSSTFASCSGYSKLRMMPATTSTFTNRGANRYTPATSVTASIPGPILTPSETDRISHEEFLRLPTTPSRSGMILTPSTTFETGHFNLPDFLEDNSDGGDFTIHQVGYYFWIHGHLHTRSCEHPIKPGQQFAH